MADVPRGAAAAGESVGTASGIAAAVRLTLTRPALLGPVRLVAVDGPSGSGKTSLAAPLADAIAAALNGSVVRPQRVADGAGCRTASRRNAPSSAVERGRGARRVAVVSTDLLATWERPLDWWPVLETHLFTPLADGSAATMPVVQWVSGTPRPGGSILVPAVDVLILEGVSSGRAAAAGRVSVLVWVEVPDAGERLERAVERDGEAMRPYLVRWQRDESAHFRADGTRARADVVIDPRASPSLVAERRMPVE